MVGQDTREVERKVISILRVLHESGEAVGAKLIARRLKDLGVELGERAVRYHLKLMDERGLTVTEQRRDGRRITPQGVEELNSALVADKVGLILGKIEVLSFRTSFDIDKKTGMVPVNVSIFTQDEFSKALQVMAQVFARGLCVSQLATVAHAGEKLGEIVIPHGRVGLATVCSLIVNGSLLKAGIPIDSRFGGVLQVRNGQPLRFADLIYYSGSTMDPSEVFIHAQMTSVLGVVEHGNGRILANFRELPARCQPLAEEVINKLRAAGLGGLLLMGSPSEAVCGIDVGLNRVGMILIGGLTPVAAAEEAGIRAENRSMSTLVNFERLVDFSEILRKAK